MAAGQNEYSVIAKRSNYTDEEIEWVVGKRLQLLTGQNFCNRI
jgi:hypothetical protein